MNTLTAWQDLASDFTGCKTADFWGSVKNVSFTLPDGYYQPAASFGSVHPFTLCG
jgi:hypothetical protein